MWPFVAFQRKTITCSCWSPPCKFHCNSVGFVLCCWWVLVFVCWSGAVGGWCLSELCLVRAIQLQYGPPWLQGKRCSQTWSGCPMGRHFEDCLALEREMNGNPHYGEASPRHAPGWQWQTLSSFLAGSFVVLSPPWGSPWAKQFLVDLLQEWSQFSISPQSWPLSSFCFSKALLLSLSVQRSQGNLLDPSLSPESKTLEGHLLYVR